MKKSTFKKMLMILPLCLLLALSGCSWSARMWEYYTDKDNYVNASGTLTYKSFDKEYGVYLSFSDLKPGFSDRSFKIAGKNVPLVRERGLTKALQIGDRVEFVSATRYFGDGYTMPIVAISVDGVEYLSFEEGYKNYLDWLKDQDYSFLL